MSTCPMQAFFADAARYAAIIFDYFFVAPTAHAMPAAAKTDEDKIYARPEEPARKRRYARRHAAEAPPCHDMPRPVQNAYHAAALRHAAERSLRSAFLPMRLCCFSLMRSPMPRPRRASSAQQRASGAPSVFFDMPLPLMNAFLSAPFERAAHAGWLPFARLPACRMPASAMPRGEPRQFAPRREGENRM